MKFTLNMTMDNAAFVDDNPGECVRILRKLADRIESGGQLSAGDGWPLLDYNGNDAGDADVEDD